VLSRLFVSSFAPLFNDTTFVYLRLKQSVHLLCGGDLRTKSKTADDKLTSNNTRKEKSQKAHQLILLATKTTRSGFTSLLLTPFSAGQAVLVISPDPFFLAGQAVLVISPDPFFDRAGGSCDFAKPLVFLQGRFPFLGGRRFLCARPLFFLAGQAVPVCDSWPLV
jgi:hypothetical protein